MTDISFGEWLKRRRGAHGWTQGQLAQKIHCSLSTLRKLESEERHPSPQLIEKLSEIFNIPQNERKSFQLFAQGDWQALSIEETADSPWQISHPTFRSNLPVLMTSFIGRNKEQVEIDHALQKDHLVTLTGVGGIGKTSLALQIGHKVRADYPDGVWFIALDSLSIPERVPQTVASVFHLHESPGQIIDEMVVVFLYKKKALLIFDNCEHLRDACAQFIMMLLKGCPNIKIIATSRERLGVAGEAVHHVLPFEVPTQNDPPNLSPTNEAVQLFAERARLADASFVLTKVNLPVIAQICSRLDGIPLAIEMAAACTDILQPQEILQQLADNFDLLINREHFTTTRHHTMRASLAWSWGLLNASEQRLIQQLTVFSSGWTLESARDICDGDVLKLINTVAKKSLIVTNKTTGSETRYSFHEIVRQFAREKLIETGNENIFRERHLSYYLKFSEQAKTALEGPEQIRWYSQLNLEYPNIRAALEFANQSNDVEAGLYLSARLKRFWESFDLKEGIYWLTKFTESPKSRNFPHARAEALCAQIMILIWLLRFDQAHAAAQESLTLYRQCRDPYGETDALLGLANITFSIGTRWESIEFGRQALALSKTIDYPSGKAAALYLLGMYHYRFERASIAGLDQVISLYRQLKDWVSLADCLGEVGNEALKQGELQTAAKYMKEAISLSRKLQNKNWLGANLQIYSRVVFLRGKPKKALLLLKESIEISAEIGNRMLYLWSRSHLGYFTMRTGNLAKTRAIFKKTIRAFLDENMEIGVIFNVEGLAGLYGMLTNAKTAAYLIGWADAARERIDDKRPPVEQLGIDGVFATCIAQMGEAAFADAYEAGKKMTLNEAVELALSE